MKKGQLAQHTLKSTFSLEKVPKYYFFVNAFFFFTNLLKLVPVYNSNIKVVSLALKRQLPCQFGRAVIVNFKLTLFWMKLLYQPFIKFSCHYIFYHCLHTDTSIQFILYTYILLQQFFFSVYATCITLSSLAPRGYSQECIFSLQYYFSGKIDLVFLM